MEDSWCWEPDNNKTDNDHSSETSSGNGQEIVNITLEEIPLGASAKGTRSKIHRLGSAAAASGQQTELQKRIQQLEDENKQLNSSLEELDSQHNLAMQNMLELKMDLQEKLSKQTKENEALKKAQEDNFIQTELEMAKLKKQLEQLQQINQENLNIQHNLDQTTAELKRSIEEMADLQSLLEKKSVDNNELINRIKELSLESEQEKEAYQQKLDLLSKELDELKVAKIKKTSESSNSSTSKQSDDEFIVVREQDTTSSSPATPPTKEELKDKIVQLENRVSELTLENGSLSLKLSDREMEKDLSLKVLKENLKSLQDENDELNEKLRMTLIDMEDQQFKMNDLKEKAAESIIAQEQLKGLKEEKLKINEDLKKLKESLQSSAELEKRLVLCEQEKESLQLELQNQKATQSRINELEQKIQNLTYQNQQLQLNAECEAETLNNSQELEEKIKALDQENNHLKSELERLNEDNFSRAIADEKQRITDLDDEDDEEEGYSLEKLKALIKTFTSSDLKDLNNEDLEKFYRHLKDKLLKLEATERELTHATAEVMELQDHKLMWDHEKKTLEADISQYILQCDELMKNNEILLNELENYKRNKLETISENNEENMVQLETQLEECNNLNRTLEQEYIELNEKIDELEKEKQTITEKLRESQHMCETLTTREKDLNLQVETLELEKCNLLLQLNERSNETQQEDSQALRIYQEKCESLEKQLSTLAKDHADLVAAMQKQKEQLHDSIQKKDLLEKALEEQHHLNAQLQENLHSLNIKQEELKQSQEMLEKCKKNLISKDTEIESLKQEVQTLQNYLKEAEGLVDKNLALEEALHEKEQKVKESYEEMKCHKEKQEQLKQDFEKIIKEKYDELVENLKKENSELQQKLETLNKELESLRETSNEDKANVNHLARIAELESEMLATKDLQKSVETLTYEKQEMIKALQQKHNENMQYYMEIQRLTPLVQQEPVDKPCEKCPSLEGNIVELRKEQEKLQDQISFLKEKSDILTTNLLTEQTNQKLVQQEKADVMEQNATLRKDLERLRAHLLESEDMHTQEIVELQKAYEETKTKMVALEDEVNKSSNAYTSAR